ncbi:hypothetical protein BBK36DRAFT_1204216 [Trichoderma citrinoviride]|uniref:Uncharacterized protein n=1 Tax=Trichoderma citrinoviride TaxID=58853 RepID=A0A2T4B7A6_9HYPO|nr:hypothetical protein BBK36DRAFT_1204216 [Trichoderma citrinoviride]PTB65109.1 hypothetical protein BBK36DRAFT_1204216 [Trichoderma citrinoviride]
MESRIASRGGLTCGLFVGGLARREARGRIGRGCREKAKNLLMAVDSSVGRTWDGEGCYASTVDVPERLLLGERSDGVDRWRIAVTSCIGRAIESRNAQKGEVEVVQEKERREREKTSAMGRKKKREETRNEESRW